MEKFAILSRIQELYERGDNVIHYLKRLDGREKNSLEDILISYDFQAGSYTEGARKNPEFVLNYAQAIASVISGLGKNTSIVEAGVGEATTLGNLAKQLGVDRCYGGFDISWSRILFARNYLTDFNCNAFLCTGDLFHAPFADSSIDLVYTSHSIEPNGGREREAIEELYRITGRFLVLLEPSYELADTAGKKRMDEHGYVTDLRKVIMKLGYKLVEYKKFELSSNPLNPTALYVIEKDASRKPTVKISPSCPISRTVLEEREDHFFSHESLLSYPKIMGIPCLTPFNAVLTSKMK